jgi:hypothetical protein
MPAPLIPVGIGALKLGAKAGLVRMAGSKLAEAGIKIGLPAAGYSFLKSLPRKELEKAVAAGPDPVSGTYESRIFPLLLPFVDEEDKEAMGKRRAAYLNRTSKQVKDRKNLLLSAGITDTLQPGEEVDDYTSRTSAKAQEIIGKRDFDNFKKYQGYVPPALQSQIDAQTSQNSLLKNQLSEQTAAREAQNTLLQGQLDESRDARLAANQEAAAARLDAVSAREAQLEYQKGRDTADMRRFELLLDREDKKEARRRNQALIQGLTTLAGSIYN